jgi:hypothetical protein
MSDAKKPFPPKKETEEWADYQDDPDTEWIEFREQITNQVNVPGVGPTAVQDYKVHRVPLPEWPAYEKTLNESKKGF